jgi:uncharacterized protein YqfA (UPF0365 family)
MNPIYSLTAVLLLAGLLLLSLRFRYLAKALGLGFWEVCKFQIQGLPLREFVALANRLGDAGLSAPTRKMIELHRGGCKVGRCVEAMLRAKEYGRIFPLMEAAALDLAGKDPVAEIERGLASRELDFPGLL